MQVIFAFGMILLILFIGMGTVIPELNRHTYEGIIVEKYREDHGMTTGTTQFIELRQGDRTIKIENSDILLHGKWDSLAVQKTFVKVRRRPCIRLDLTYPVFASIRTCIKLSNNHFLNETQKVETRT